MAHKVMSNEKICDHLNTLIQVDFDAISAYDAAIERLEGDDEARRALEGFRQDHLRHTQDLGRLVEQCGGQPATRGDAKSFVTKGMVMLGGLLGNEAVLRAMNTNERVTNEYYERALHKDFPENVMDVVRRNREDERRHKSWIEARLERGRAKGAPEPRAGM
ncbi:PA2169 family four-helix-bundle protein [Myxococcota bacterium]|nr:PA2169 family four-helix-bundle protein [Myxococcota bacterium]